MLKREFEKLSGYKKSKKIGSGVAGTVYAIKGNPKLIVKEQPINLFKRELPPAIYLSKINVLPKIRGVYQSKRKGYIIQDRYDGTLRDIIKKKVKNTSGVTKDGDLNKNSRRKLRTVIRKMHKAGVVHLNLHTDNIVYKKTPTGLVFKVIDTGRAQGVDTPMKTLDNIKRETRKRAKKMFKYRPEDVQRTVDRELQFYKGTPLPKYDFSPDERQLKIFKGI